MYLFGANYYREVERMSVLKIIEIPIINEARIVLSFVYLFILP